MHVESNKTKTFRPLLLCMVNTLHGLSEYTNIWVHPIKTFLWQHILRIPFFYISPKNRLHFYTPCQVLVINLDKTSSMVKFSWSFVRWAMLQTVNWVILPNGMMQNTLQLIMPQVCHITCSAILPALTLGLCLHSGGTQVWFWCRHEFESRPIQIPVFQEKVTHSYTNWPNFGPNFERNYRFFSKIFLNLSQFWLKFGQILKNRPIHIPDFAFHKGSFIY